MSEQFSITALNVIDKMLHYIFQVRIKNFSMSKSNRKAMNRNWSNQKANPALNTKTENKCILHIDKIQ